MVLFILPLAYGQDDQNEFKTLFGDRHISNGGYYRLTSSVRFSEPRILSEPPPTNVLEGFSGGITLKFGKF